ncbi:MAG: nucleoside hydrolase [Gemmatimonadota bacterium]|nr:nucleoside hydrolase [Gemmatimonadota bacterium]
MDRTFLIDTDTASDDAVALIMALRTSDVRVAAITVVAGNVPLPQAVRNALFTVELCGDDTPVHAGAARPLRRSLQSAEFFHGEDGLGDQGYPPPRAQPASEDAIEAILRASREHPGLTVVTLGPLTNIALALDRDPSFAENIGRLVIMGGAPLTVGNMTPAAEFNLWVDPEAAAAVIDAGMPTELVGWELCRGEAILSHDEMSRVKAFDTEIAHFSIDCNETAVEANFRQSGARGLGLPDPVAMAVALRPDIVRRGSRHHVMIETGSELTRGMTVVDQLGVCGEPQNRATWGDRADREAWTRVTWEIDVSSFKQLLFSILRAG